MGKNLRLSYAILIIPLTLLMCSRSGLPVTHQGTTPPNFKIAFIGDQSLGPNSVAVLNLIKAEGAQAVMISGDLDYIDNPATWEAQINSVLGEDFPVFVAIGNHDAAAWSGSGGYQQYVKDRFNRLGISWSGDLGVQSSFHYNGLFFVITAPGIAGFDNGSSDTYIRDQLAADTSVWSICSWHKDQKLMQAGGLFQLLETVADRSLRHRLQPQALDRFLVAGVPDDVAEYQFALATRVACVDDARYVLACEQFHQ